MRVFALAILSAVTSLVLVMSSAVYVTAGETSGGQIEELLYMGDLLRSAAGEQPLEEEQEEQEEQSIADSIAEIVDLIKNYRYKKSKELYDLLMSSRNTWGKSPRNRQLIEDHRNILGYMAEQCALGQGIIASAESSSNNTDWVFGLEMFGITTHYRVDKSTGIVSVKVAGVLEDVPIAELVSVLYEVDLYKSWMPFITDSRRVYVAGEAEILGYVQFSVPITFMSRDTLFAAQGIDLLLEDGVLVLAAKSCNGDTVEQYVNTRAERLAIGNPAASNVSRECPPYVEVPLKSPGWLHQQMEIIDFTAVMEPLSPISVRNVLILTLDLKAHLPHVVINFLIKNLAGLFLHLLKSQVKKVAATEDNLHKQAIRANPAFYKDWLLPKIKTLFRERNWELEVPSCLL